jgi:ribosomal protein S27AE
MPEESGFMWRWGACPRCGAAAWIDAHDDANAACSKQCGFSIWEYLESEYAWERAHRAAGFAHLLDDRGRVPLDTP